MELVAPKNSLLNLLRRCQGVADKKSTMPVLANVLLSADDNRLHVAATDLYLSVSGSLEAEVKRAGSIAIPARDLYERVERMPDGPIRIGVGEGAATTIQAQGSARRYTLHGLPGSDFPTLPKPTPEAPSIELPVDVLGTLIERTLFSISSDETRAHLNSALFECADGKVRMVTTDGHRLSKMELCVPELAVEGRSARATMLIPNKAIKELRRLVDEVQNHRESTKIKMTQSGPSAFFHLLGVQFSVKLVDAQFPPYEAVIPPGAADRALRTARVPLIDALKAVSLAASERTGGVKLSVQKSMLRITSESPESGSGFDEVPIDYSGPDLSVGFNAKYLIDVLQVIKDDDVTVGLSGELDPAVLRPAAKDTATNGDYVAVVMPMRI